MDRTVELILVASVLMITAIFAMTAFTSGFSSTKGFLEKLNKKASSKECQNRAEAGEQLDNKCLNKVDEGERVKQVGQKHNIIPDDLGN